MPTPVDEASFAQLVARFSNYLDELRGTLRRVLVQSLSGPGPVVLSEDLHGGKSLLVENGGATAAITLTLPADAPVGTLFLADQTGPAPVKLVPAAGGMLRHRLGHNGSAGQWASLSVRCIRPGEWLLAGDTAVVA